MPSDVVLTVEVTNNAKDTQPVWQDVTEEVKSGSNFLFQNRVAQNGAAFSFRVKEKRGASDAEGFITSIYGAFQ